METVAIIGSGITGLTAGFYLRRSGIPVTIYEASSQTGGVIQTTLRDGFLIENGPNTILESSAEVPALINDLGLTSRRLDPSPAAKTRFLVRNGQMLGLPGSLLGAIRWPLLTLAGKLRVLAEPFIRRGTADDEALASFVRRRLGSEILDYCIDPMVGGIYAGNPERLSVKHAFPRLQALEEKYGSLIKGTILGARERKKRGVKSKASAPMFSFDGGLSVLIDELQKNLAGTIKLNTPVSQVEKTRAGWVVHTLTGEVRPHSAVLVTTPAYRAAQINIDGVEQRDQDAVRLIYYPPIVRVALGYRKDQIAHPLDGFGVLIPSKEHMNSLGILFTSSLFPHRAPEGHAVLTAFLGGSRNPDILKAKDDQLVEHAIADARQLLGITGDPVFQDVLRIPFAIPQYNVGYGEVKAAVDRVEAQAPGVFVAANYRNGISVADCIASGKQVSERLIQYVGANAHAPLAA